MPMIPVKEAMKGVAIAEPEVKEHDVDLLIVGGGMGACGAAFEAVRWGDKHGLKMMLREVSRWLRRKLLKRKICLTVKRL